MKLDNGLHVTPSKLCAQTWVSLRDVSKSASRAWAQLRQHHGAGTSGLRSHPFSLSAAQGAEQPFSPPAAALPWGGSRGWAVRCSLAALLPLPPLAGRAGPGRYRELPPGLDAGSRPAAGLPAAVGGRVSACGVASRWEAARGAAPREAEGRRRRRCLRWGHGGASRQVGKWPPAAVIAFVRRTEASGGFGRRCRQFRGSRIPPDRPLLAFPGASACFGLR